jgi:hypothetical protein
MTVLGIVAFGPGFDASRRVQADGPPSVSSNNSPSSASDAFAFIEASRERLGKLEAEVVAVGTEALRPVYAERERRDHVVNQLITVQSAEANYENAKLTREVAEIGLAEYEEGIFVQDQATVEGEVHLAEADAARADDAIELAKWRLDEIKKLSRGSAQDLSLEFALADQIVDAQLREPRAQLAQEQAWTKRDVLRRFVKAKRVKEIKAGVEKARSDEFAKQAQWEREKYKLKKLQEPIKPRNLSINEQRTLDVLRQAVPVIENLKARLAQAARDNRSLESLRTEINKMLDQLGELVDQAQAEHAATTWAKLIPQLHDAAVRYLEAGPK